MTRIRSGVSAGLTAAVLLLSGCAESGGGEPGGGGDTDRPIRIGAVLDITGAGASLGGPQKQALKLLADQVNERGGVDGKPVELFIEDDQSTEDGAAKAMSRLLSEKQVDVILGASRSGPSFAMAEIAESSKVPMLSLAANVKVVDGKTWVFKTAQNDAAVLENIVDIAVERDFSTLGMVMDSSGYGDGVEETLNQLGKPKGIKVVRTEKFAPDATDFTAQMVNIRKAGADANIIWGIPPAAALAQKAYRQLEIDAPVFQSHGVGNSVFLETVKDAADGAIVPLGRMVVADQLPDDDPQKPVIATFAASFSKAYGQPPSTFAGHAYDAFMLAIDAFTAVGTDRAKIRDHLEGVRDFAGCSGVFTFSPDNHSGLDKRDLAIVTVKDGAWKLVDANRD